MKCKWVKVMPDEPWPVYRCEVCGWVVEVRNVEPEGALAELPSCGIAMLQVQERAAFRERRETSRTQPSHGLGDTIAKLTRAIGIKPCGGCKKRQAALNKLVPYRKRTL